MNFPQPLTPFERYMFLDDRVDYPMNMFCRLRFRGQIDLDRLLSLRPVVLPRHPLITAVVREDERGRLVWDEAPNPIQVRMYELTEDGAYPQADRIDLTQESGLRVWYAENEEESELTFQIHHAAADGVGALQIAHDFLLAYHAATLETPAEKRVLRTYQPELLNQRMSLGLTFWKFLAILPQQSVGLAGAGQFFFRKPVCLGRESASQPDVAPVGFPAALTRDLTAEETDAYQEAALAAATTVNDLLLADLFATLADWQKRYGIDDKQWLRMMAPINLRQYADRRLPAANVVSMIFLDRTPEQIADEKGLLRSLREEIALIQRYNLGLTFVLFLKGMSYFKNGIKSMTKREECKSSCVMTNLGEPLAKIKLPRENDGLRSGDVLVTGLDLIAPIRPQTRLAVTAFRFEGRQALNLHWDNRCVERADAEAFLDDCFRRMRARLVGMKTKSVESSNGALKALEPAAG